jgi:hypothetical protein
MATCIAPANTKIANLTNIVFTDIITHPFAVSYWLITLRVSRGVLAVGSTRLFDTSCFICGPLVTSAASFHRTSLGL